MHFLESLCSMSLDFRPISQISSDLKMAGPSTRDIVDLATKLASTEIRSKAPLTSRFIQVPRGYEVASRIEPKLLLSLRDKWEKKFGNFVLNGKIIRYGFQAEELLFKGALDLPDSQLRQPSNLRDEVHPLFERDNFDDCPDQIYDQLLPGLRLATKFITSSPLLQHWITTLFGERKRTLDSSGAFNRERIDWDVPLSPDNIAKFVTASRTWAKLFHVTFIPQLNKHGSDDDDPCCGYTHPIVDYNKNETVPCNRPLEGLRLATRSRIKLHGDYYIAASKFAVMKYPNVAQKLRFNLMFAITIVHELAHAVENSFKDLNSPCEVYIGDNVESEAGLSWETSVFGGTVTPINGRLDCSLGLAITNWPYTHVGGHTIGMSPAIVSSVPMDFINALQQESFWEKSVECSSALHVPRDKSAHSLALPYTTTMHQDADMEEKWIECKKRHRQEPNEPPTQKRRLIQYNGSSVIMTCLQGTDQHSQNNNIEDDSNSPDDGSTSLESLSREPTSLEQSYLASSAGPHTRRDRSRSSGGRSREQKKRREQRLAAKEHQNAMKRMSRTSLLEKDKEVDLDLEIDTEVDLEMEIDTEEVIEPRCSSVEDDLIDSIHLCANS